ncbi:acetylornithine deacetylase [Arhodomonas aquaeolei]|uniref:acetylornithine deacetylase n=1 Tax=Arhodomonas aquaeolei TaxID=2369 RepID=UPI00216A2E84|nr:acetylornithine deacetylase [Arhodomonas aquaeolei]MCS4502959.1 acetylornithine deacetylase [Arhodomonas aquaeolei]
MSRIPDVRRMIAELVALPSVSSVDPALDQGNLAVIECLAEWCEALGFAVDIRRLPGDPGKANLVATLGRGEGGLVLAGHTDTVPFDADRWASAPFTLSERQGRLHGLGTSDMKAFLALALEAVRTLEAGQLDAPLVLLATADEESGMEGAKALAGSGPVAGRQAIIGEPTGLHPIRVHKGMMMEAVRVTGRSGHSSDPSLGINALEAMHGVIGELMTWRDELGRRYRDERFAVPVPTLNLGHIHGGDNPNRICGEVVLHYDLRPLPGMSPEALRAEVETRLRGVMAERPGELTLSSLFPGQPPMETPETAEIVAAARALTGEEPGAVAFGTEGPWLRDLGMDVIILGPGDIAQAHQPDEFIALDRLAPTVTLLQRFIHRFCMEGAA